MKKNIDFYLYFTGLSEYKEVSILIKNGVINLCEQVKDIFYQRIQLDEEDLKNQIQYSYQIQKSKSIYSTQNIQRRLINFMDTQSDSESICIFDTPLQFILKQKAGSNSKEQAYYQKDIEKSLEQFFQLIKQQDLIVNRLRYFIVKSSFGNQNQLLKAINNYIIKEIKQEQDAGQLIKYIETLTDEAKSENSYIIYCKIKQISHGYLRQDLNEIIQDLHKNFTIIDILKELTLKNSLFERRLLQESFINKLNSQSPQQFNLQKTEIERLIINYSKNFQQEAIKINQAFLLKKVISITLPRYQLQYLLENYEDIKNIFKDDDFIQVNDFILKNIVGKLTDKEIKLHSGGFIEYFITNIEDFQRCYDENFQIIKDFFKDMNFMNLQPIFQIRLIQFMQYHEQQLEINIKQLIESYSFMQNLKSINQITHISNYFSEQDPKISQYNFLLSIFGQFINDLQDKDIKFTFSYQQKFVELLKYQQFYQESYQKEQISIATSDQNNIKQMNIEQQKQLNNNIRSYQHDQNFEEENQNKVKQIKIEMINHTDINKFQVEYQQQQISQVSSDQNSIKQKIEEEQEQLDTTIISNQDGQNFDEENQNKAKQIKIEMINHTDINKFLVEYQQQQISQVISDQNSIKQKIEEEQEQLDTTIISISDSQNFEEENNNKIQQIKQEINNDTDIYKYQVQYQQQQISQFTSDQNNIKQMIEEKQEQLDTTIISNQDSQNSEEKNKNKMQQIKQEIINDNDINKCQVQYQQQQISQVTSDQNNIKQMIEEEQEQLDTTIRCKQDNQNFEEENKNKISQIQLEITNDNNINKLQAQYQHEQISETTSGQNNIEQMIEEKQEQLDASIRSIQDNQYFEEEKKSEIKQIKLEIINDNDIDKFQAYQKQQISEPTSDQSSIEQIIEEKQEKLDTSVSSNQVNQYYQEQNQSKIQQINFQKINKSDIDKFEVETYQILVQYFNQNFEKIYLIISEESNIENLSKIENMVQQIFKNKICISWLTKYYVSYQDCLKEKKILNKEQESVLMKIQLLFENEATKQYEQSQQQTDKQVPFGKEYLKFLKISDQRPNFPFRNRLSQDFKMFIKHLEENKISSIKSTLQNKQFEEIYNFFQEKISFSEFKRQIEQEISLISAEKEKFSQLLNRFPYYLDNEQYLFEQIFQTDRKLGEIKKQIQNLKETKILYDYFDLLRESSIFNKIILMLQQQEEISKVLKNVNNILYYSKIELINLIQIINGNKNIQVKCLDKFQIKEKNSERNFDEEFDEDESFLFPKKILTIQNLIQISGISFMESANSFKVLYKLLQIEEEQTLSETLERAFHISFLNSNGKYLIEIAKQNDIKLQSYDNKQFYQDLEKLANTNHTEVSKKSIYDLSNQYRCLFSFPKNFYYGTERQDSAVSTISKLDSIIKYIIENLQNHSFLDMKDLIDADENIDLQYLLIKLNNQREIFDHLVKKREHYQRSDKASLVKFIQEIVEFSRQYLENPVVQLELEQCSENFYKIELKGSQKNQKNFISLAIEVVQDGEFQFLLEQNKDNKEKVKLIVEQKEVNYSELEIRKICSKVIIDSNMVKTYAEFQLNKNISKSKVLLSEQQIEEEEYSLTNIRDLEKQIKETIEKFKEQWFAAERLKEVISNLISFGKFDILKQKIVYSNKNGQRENNFNKMKSDHTHYSEQLTEWKNQISIIFKKFPIFSLIGFQYYQELIDYCEKGNYQSFKEANPDLINILKYMNLSQKDILLMQSLIKIDQCYFSKLNCIAKYCSEIWQKQYNQMIDENSEEINLQNQRFKNKMVKYIFSGSQELTEILIGGVQDQDGYQGDYYKYLFCDKSTNITDLQLFMFRFQNLITNNKQNTYYLVINSKLQVKFINQMNELLSEYNNQIYHFKNQLIVLIREEFDQKQISCLSQEKKINKLSKPSILYQNAIVYYSQSAGSGKTFEITKKINEKNENFFRIPIYGSGNKISLLQIFRQKLNKVTANKLHIHLDVYETSEQDLNLLLFELVVLRSLSIHSDQLIYFEKLNQVTFYIEIANTLNEDLYQSILIKNFFNKQIIQFEANRFQLESTLKSEEETINHRAALQYLYYQDLLKKTNVNNFNQEQNDQSYKLNEQILSNMNNLINNFILNHLEVPCFYQVVRFLNLFGSEMRKMNKSCFISPETIKSIGLDHNLRKEIVIQSYNLCVNICFTKYIEKNQNQTNKQSKEDQLFFKSKNIQKFSEFVIDFLAFQEQEAPSLSLVYKNENSVPPQILKLVKSQTANLLYFDENQEPQDLLRWLVKLINKHDQKVYKDNQSNVFNKDYDGLRKLAEKIIIQKDNFFKIAMIFMRIRANSPVIIMGQSGIGKSILIELMSAIMEAEFKIITVHAGITEQDIAKLIEECIRISKIKKEANENNQKVVVFFDEVNTNKLVNGLFKEIIVDRHINGEPIPSNIIPIAAINPYKKKSDQQKKMIDIQIHGGIKKDMVKKIKSTDLEYSVEPIPESMYNFIWNFDKLQQGDEKKYIYQILRIQFGQKLNDDKNQQIYKIFYDKQLDPISKGIYQSQAFLREKMGYESACSLRDVSRFIKLLFWFIKFLSKFRQFDLQISDGDFQNTCIYLSFYINYCIRLPLIQLRKEYFKSLSSQFDQPDKKIWEKIDLIQTFIINQTEVPDGIVKNTALKQNVFALFVSMVNKIPVVLIGPPGCSKTLSLRIIIKSMKGKQSKFPLFQELETLMPLLYQGHIQSTSEKILEVFERAKNKVDQYKKQNENSKYISMVHLEEIGLAEISPHNPLKVLHQTLENPEIAIACISNWPLDQSKMNRMLAIYRLDVDQEELVETLKCTEEYVHSLEKKQSIINTLKRVKINKELQMCIAKSYQSYLEQVKKVFPEHEQFHGLRDFYGMAKLLFSNIIKNKQTNKFLITDSFLRHFSGLQTHDILFETLKKEFQKYFKDYKQEISQIQKNVQLQIELIQDNLKEKSDYFISRHLMIITQHSQAALEFINNELISLQKPYQIFMGSDFSLDQKSQNTYKIINEIIYCVEKGIIIVLKNLDNIYQSLYDLLNQNYKEFNGKNYCSISFNADSREIPVSPDFKIILIVNQSQIHKMDGPLLNRFEKHTFSESMIISKQDQDKINRINQYFIDLNQNMFNFNNIKELIQSLVLQQNKLRGSSEEDYVKQQIYHLTSFRFAIQMINQQDEEFKNKYIESNYHYSLNHFIENRIFQQEEQSDNAKLYCIYSPQQVVSSKLKYISKIIKISQIESEQALINQLQSFFENLNTDHKNKSILMVTCDFYVDSFERVSFVRQKIIEKRLSFQRPCNIIICIRTTDRFKALPYFGNFEQHFIEDLYYDQDFGGDLCLSEMINKFDENLKSVINFEKLIQIVISNKEFISNSFSLVSYANIEQKNFIIDRLRDIFTIFSFKDEDEIFVIASQFIQTQIDIFLEQNESRLVRDYIYKQIIDKGKAQQRISLLSAIKEGVIENIQIGVAKYIALVENNSLTYQMIQSVNNNSLKKVIAQFLLDILKIEEIDYKDKQKLKIQIKANNQKFELTVNSQPKNFKFPYSQKYISILEECIKEIDKTEFIIEKAQNNEMEEHEDPEIIQKNQDSFSLMLDILYKNFEGQLQDYELANLVLFTKIFMEDYLNYGVKETNLIYIDISLKLIKLINSKKQSDPSQEMEIENNQKEQEKENFKLDIQAMIILNLYKEDILRIDEIITQFDWISKKEDIIKKLEFNVDAPKETHIFRFMQSLVQHLIELLKPSEKLVKKMRSQYINYKDLVQELDRFIDFYELSKSGEIKSGQQKLYLQQIFISDIMGNLQIDESSKIFDKLQDITNYNIEVFEELKTIVKELYLNQQENELQNSNLQASKAPKLIKKICKPKKNQNKNAFQNEEEDEEINQQNEEINDLKEKSKQFEMKWTYFVLDVLQSKISQGMFYDVLVLAVNQLVKIEENLDELQINPLPKDFIIKFNIILNIPFRKLQKLESLINLFDKEKERPLLDQNYPKQTEHAVFVIITDIIQINCLNRLKNQQIEQFQELVSIICQAGSPEQLTLFQKLIFFSIYRELTFALCLSPDQQEIEFDINSLYTFYSQINNESLQLYVVKQIYHQYGGDQMATFIKDSQVFSSIEWLKKLSQGFINLLSSSFLTSSQSQQYKSYFQNEQNFKEQLINFFEDELKNSNNLFKSLYEGKINKNCYYPFSKLNNIQLFRYDMQNNTQLYQCQNCKEFIFSDKCPNLKSQFICQRCGWQIVKGNPNTKQVFQDANVNQNGLKAIMNQNQWQGIYMKLMKGITDDQLDQGNSLDLRIFTLMYSISITSAMNQKRFNQLKEVQMTSFKNKQPLQSQETIWELCEDLKIYYKENPQNFLNEQIDLAIEQIFDIMRFKDIKQQDISIIVFKIISEILNDPSIIPLQNPDQRSNKNTELSLKVQDIIQKSKLVLEEQKSGEIYQLKVLETFEYINTEQKIQNYYKNLRYVKVSNEPNFIQRQIQTQDNNIYQSIKQILDSENLDYLSKSLQVLVNFTQKMQNYLSNTITLKTAKNTTLKMVLKDDVTHPLFKFYLEQLIPTWEKIKEKEEEFRIGCKSYKIYDLDLETKLNDLVYSSNKEDGIFSNIFEILCFKQNNTIQYIESLLNSTNKMQKKIFINQKPTKPVQSLDYNLNILKSYDERIIRKYFMNSPEYREGNKYILDLQQLQDELIQICLTGTVIIDLQNSKKFSFSPEISDLGFLSDIQINQESISQKDKQNLQQQLIQSKEQMYELLNKSIRIFQFYKKTRGQEEIPLKQAFDNVKIQVKIPIMSENLKLKHLNSLICTLEEFNIDNLVDLCDQSYKQEIEQKKIDKVLKFISSSKLELSNFQLALGRFIFRYLTKQSFDLNSKLFEQIFNVEIYGEIWNDSSKIESLYKDALKFDILIKESFSLYQKLKQKTNQNCKNLQKDYEMDIEDNQESNENMYLESFSDEVFNKKIIDS
ncbi:hypothetical protein ABPG74_009864 [Tetrahymena malaccensis]